MKKICAVVIIVLASFNCGGGSSSDDASDYILQPGGLTATTLNQDFDVDFAGTTYVKPTYPNLYAILYKGISGSVNYIGLSLDTDGIPGDDSGFNLKLYYEDSSFPSGTIQLTKGSKNFTVKVKSGVTSYSEINDGDNSITLNFSAIDSDNIITITAANPTDTLIMTGTPNQTLRIRTIKAYVYQ